MGFDGAAIEGLLDGAVDAGSLAGVAASVVDRDGVLFTHAAGDARENTMYRNASMTKAPATVGALQLVERGQLDLEATVESILPEFGTLQVLDGFDGERPRLRAPASKATVRQLMYHTAGCGYPFGNEALHRYVRLEGVPDLFSGSRLALLAPLVRDPGTYWEYGVNTDWLGLVVEEISSTTLDVYLAENVYGPLGMSDSTFAPSAEQRARLLDIRVRSASGSLDPFELDISEEPEWASGGHGSYGTIGDYGRFIRAMLRGGELDGERVLAAETVDSAFTDQLHGIPLPQGVKSAEPLLTNDVPPLPFAQGWGLGFHLIEEDIPGGCRRGTGDWSGIFNTYYWIDRASGIGGLMMTQVLPFFDLKIVETLFALQAAVYEQVAGAAPVS